MSQKHSPAVLQTLDYHLMNSPLSVIEWDHEFKVKKWSGRAESIFGWSETEVLGKHPSDWVFVHEDDTEDVNRTMAELLSGSSSRNISRNRNYTKDGGVVSCEWYNSVLIDDEGELVSVLSLIHDVTERELMESQLRQLQKMESVGQLTGGVAHDFNNLLTVILGNSELLSEQLETQPNLKELASSIMVAAQKGAALTHQLLAFARQQPLRPKVTDINQLLTSMRNMLDRTLGEEIEIELISSGSLWKVEVDPTQLESAVLNLTLNARDSMPGGGKLTIESSNVVLDEHYSSVRGDVLPGEYTMIAVSDTGRGISKEILSRVFEPFFTTKSRGKGTGLGLSMVFGFIKQSNGHLNIYSEVDEGTTVRMYLPRSQDSTLTSTDALSDDTKAVSGTEVILLVEDDVLVRGYVMSQLQRLGYRVVAAANGDEALKVLQSDEKLDLLFTDVVMPGGINGRELADRARKLRSNIRVLFTSGYTENAIIHHGRLDPGVLLLSKPYRSSDLASYVRDALKQPIG